MASLVHLDGTFDAVLVSKCKKALRTVDNSTNTIYVRVNSYGGNVFSMNVISAFLYFMVKYKKCEIIFEIIHAESAALMLAVNFPVRHVTNNSLGSIHLPIRSKGKYLSKQEIKEKEDAAIDFYIRKTKLKSEEEVRMLNGVLLSAQEMIDFGIATKLVDEFYSEK